MRSERKTKGFFTKINEPKLKKQDTLRELLLEKSYAEARAMLAADHRLYYTCPYELTDQHQNKFKKITTFTYMLWLQDGDAINTFIEACKDQGTEYLSLEQIQKELEAFIKSGTCVQINNINYKNHKGNAESIDYDSILNAIKSRRAEIKTSNMNAIYKSQNI